MWNAISLIQDLNLCRRLHKHYTIGTSCAIYTYIYIYIYLIIIIIMSYCWYGFSRLSLATCLSHPLYGFSWLSLAICLSYPLLLTGLPDYTLCLQRIGVDDFLSVIQHLYVCMKGSTREHHLWVHSYFSNSVPHVLSNLLDGFRWELGDHITAVLWDATSRICST